MDQEDAMREQMEETRTSLTEKLETLERQVAGTVRGATAAVAEKAEAVREAVENTVSSVKDTLCQGAATVRDMADVRGHVERHPWAMLAGSVAVGYVTAALVERGLRRHPHPAHPFAAPGSLAEANGRKAAPEHTLLGGLFAKFGPEISKLKNIALSALFEAVREKVMEATPEEFAPSLQSFFDSVGEKITGERPSAVPASQSQTL
jgi:ElaB/YqjD/DUF883 family membrane-anchored ribosome-binding protein